MRTTLHSLTRMLFSRLARIRPVWFLAVGLTLGILIPRGGRADVICAGIDPSPLTGEGDTINALGPHGALFIFARFTDGADVDGLDSNGAPIPLPECSGCGEGWPATQTTLPSWANQMLENTTSPVIPGSLSHYFDRMSLGNHQLIGETVDQVIESDLTLQELNQPLGGGIAQANKHIIEKLVAIKGASYLAQFDLNSPEGGPDGYVDYIFIHYRREGSCSGRAAGTIIMLRSIPARPPCRVLS